MPSSSAYSSSGIRIREGVLPLFSLVILALGLGRSTMASPTATITGRVTDSLGGSLAGALVEVTNVETNTVVRTKTNQRGLYRVSNLQPGHYRVIVRMFGFRTMVKPGLRLHVQDVIGLNFSMQLGSAIASITQDEGVPLVQAETGMQSAAINQFFIANLPSLTRNPYDFVALSAGAAPTRSCGVGYALNGQRSESGSFLLDGSDNNNAHDPGPGQIVPLDVVEEYRLMTHNFTAEYGRNTGFIANVVTKNGTNDFHGAAYYFNRNSALAANTYENNARGIPRPVFNRQQMGGSAGGPLLRDKLFFMQRVNPSWSGVQQRSAIMSPRQTCWLSVRLARTRCLAGSRSLRISQDRMSAFVLCARLADSAAQRSTAGSSRFLRSHQPRALAMWMPALEYHRTHFSGRTAWTSS